MAVNGDDRGTWTTEFHSQLMQLPFTELAQDSAARGSLRTETIFTIKLPQVREVGCRTCKRSDSSVALLCTDPQSW